MAIHAGEPEVIYPDSDGEPMADNTLQFEWIVTIEGGLDALYRNDPDVFVAGDLLWYAVEGNNTIRLAPDAMVAFGRPKGYRGSYRQWEEDHIAPQVVFEVLSPGNTRGEMVRKRQWYERYGVEEYYEYDPDHGTLKGWWRQGAQLVAVPVMQGWVSPRLGVRFGLEGSDLVLIGPDGQRFESYVVLVERRSQAEARAQEAASRAEQAEAQAQESANRAEQAEAQAQESANRAAQADARAQEAVSQVEQVEARAQETISQAEQQTQEAISRATKAEERAKRLEARLKELGLSIEL